MKEIVIDASGLHNIIGIFENNKIVELYIEKENELLGNIYKGKVTTVLPGLGAAFVNTGEGKNAYLETSDVFDKMEIDADIPPEIMNTLPKKKLVPGQDILVQIIREPIHTKGPKVTTKISLAGKYFVFIPQFDFIGISRKIEDEKEKERLKEIARDIKPQDGGVIVRTSAENTSYEELKKEISQLISKWHNILETYKSVPSPRLIYKDLPLTYRIIRDCLNQSVGRIIVNDIMEYKNISKFIESISPDPKDKEVVSLYQGTPPLTTQYNFKKCIEDVLKEKIYLKSGGYIVLEHTESLTAIDVNTGKFVGKSKFEETAFKTNIEAAEEISRQIRLRDIGGIIVIDFIDMKEEEHKQKIIEVLKEESKKDRSRLNILPLTELGLVQITRKRLGTSIEEILTHKCPYCQGKGRIREEIGIF